MVNDSVIRSPSPKLAVSGTHEKWRLLKDAFARYAVVLGGLGVIAAIVLIFFYLLYVVMPLFAPASVAAITQYEVPDKTSGNTVLLETEEQNEVAVRFTDTGQLVFFSTATGQHLLSQTVAIPELARVSSFGQSNSASQGGNRVRILKRQRGDSES